MWPAIINGFGVCYMLNVFVYCPVISPSSRNLVYPLCDIHVPEWAYGVVVSMFDFHRSDRGSNPGRGGKIS